MYQHLRYAVDADGIATLTLDVAGKPMNVLEPVFNAELAAAVEAAVADPAYYLRQGRFRGWRGHQGTG